jgi:hypothetical protein
LAPGYSTPPTRRRDSDISNARHRSDLTAYKSDHVIVISVRSGNNTKPFMQVAPLAQEEIVAGDDDCAMSGVFCGLLFC